MNTSPAGDPGFTHLGPTGQARMVDTGEKPVTRRLARASGRVRMQPETVSRIVDSSVAKGDVLATARIAGIMAAKQTSGLIPLCHPLGLDAVSVEFNLAEEAVEIAATVTVTGRTGVEMEALTAVSVAALTIYDMCKSVDREMTVEAVRLDEKSGGRGGRYLREGARQ